MIGPTGDTDAFLGYGNVRVDPVGMWVIGPFGGRKLPFNEEVFGFQAQPELPYCSKALKHLPPQGDDDGDTAPGVAGKPKRKRPLVEPCKLTIRPDGPGYHLSAYRPEDRRRKHIFVVQTFHAMLGRRETRQHDFDALLAMEAIINADNGMFPMIKARNPNLTVGDESWKWPMLPLATVSYTHLTLPTKRIV